MNAYRLSFTLFALLAIVGMTWAQEARHPKAANNVGQTTKIDRSRSTSTIRAKSPSDLTEPELERTTHIDDKGKHEAPKIDYWSMLFVFVLSSFIGLGVIGRVSRLLHTPLMSLTNAISAIAVVGSIVVTGTEDYPLPIRIMGAVALFASMTNIVSGFLITDRMLRMFKQTRQPV